MSRYHIPRSWFHPSGNTLVVFEERGGDPTKITFSRRAVTSVCSFVSEHFPSIDLDSWDKSDTNEGTSPAKVQLSCPGGKNISSVKFASLGNPSGTCRSYQKGRCHHPNSLSVVEKVKFARNSRFLTQVLTWSRFQYQITVGPDISSLTFWDVVMHWCMWTWIHAHELSLGIRSLWGPEFWLCSVAAIGIRLWFTVPYHQVFVLGPLGFGWRWISARANYIFQSNHEVHMNCLIIDYQLWVHWDPH